MKELRASLRYARALFEVCDQKNCISDALNQLSVVSALLKDPKTISFLKSSSVPEKEKAELLKKAFGQRFAPPVYQFILILLKRNRLFEIDNIRDIFKKFSEKKEGLEHVEVISAIPLEKSFLENFRPSLEKKLKNKVAFTQTTDPSILGGAIFRFGSMQIDASTKSRLAGLKQRLIG